MVYLCNWLGFELCSNNTYIATYNHCSYFGFSVSSPILWSMWKEKLHHTKIFCTVSSRPSSSLFMSAVNGVIDFQWLAISTGKTTNWTFFNQKGKTTSVENYCFSAVPCTHTEIKYNYNNYTINLKISRVAVEYKEVSKAFWICVLL